MDLETINTVANILRDKKATNIIALDVRGIDAYEAISYPAGAPFTIRQDWREAGAAPSALVIQGKEHSLTEPNTPEEIWLSALRFLLGPTRSIIAPCKSQGCYRRSSLRFFLRLRRGHQRVTFLAH